MRQRTSTIGNVFPDSARNLSRKKVTKLKQLFKCALTGVFVVAVIGTVIGCDSSDDSAPTTSRPSTTTSRPSTTSSRPTTTTSRPSTMNSQNSGNFSTLERECIDWGVKATGIRITQEEINSNPSQWRSIVQGCRNIRDGAQEVCSAAPELGLDMRNRDDALALWIISGAPGDFEHIWAGIRVWC